MAILGPLGVLAASTRTVRVRLALAGAERTAFFLRLACILAESGSEKDEPWPGRALQFGVGHWCGPQAFYPLSLPQLRFIALQIQCLVPDNLLWVCLPGVP